MPTPFLLKMSITKLPKFLGLFVLELIENSSGVLSDNQLATDDTAHTTKSPFHELHTTIISGICTLH